MDIAFSKNSVPIRLTPERWMHIVENHDDVAGYFDDVLGTVEDPDYIIEGYQGAFNALRSCEQGKYLLVAYRESSPSDGFIITAYFTKKLKLEQEVIIWRRQA